MDFSICPICNLCVSSLELQRHANDHFSDENEDRDLQLALSISIIPPSPTPANTRALEKSLRENVGWQRLIKRGVHTLEKPQYQLCFIDPGIAHGEELEKLKTLHSIRHEF